MDPQLITANNKEQTAAYSNGKMPKWAMNDEIVISGIAGRYPESDSIAEFSKQLYGNIDMVTENEKRWPFGFLGLPKGSGTLKDISKFDAEFFGISEKEANLMDAQIRIMLELAYEAIWDSGIDPNTLHSSNTGTFVGSCWDDIPTGQAEDYTKITGYKQNFTGILSNAFNLYGPTKLFDTACASSMTAFHEAIVSLRSNECDRAIVTGINICTRSYIQNLFYRLKMISPDGHCKCLDADANGYAKGEACVVLVLQKRSEAKRVYASVMHTKANCDGYIDLGITYPSWELQRDLMRDTYTEAGISPSCISYIEAHCTGTQAGDTAEMKAIQHSMCNENREPLLIGAVKSNIGHTEAASGLCAISKVILSFENQCIPANLHYSVPNPEIEGLMNGSLKPINKNTPFNGRFVGLNGFGYGGANVHVVLESNGNAQKPNNNDIYGKLPRLVNMCARSSESLIYFFDSLKYMDRSRVTRDLLSLINDISKTSATQTRTSISPMNYRGFTIFENNDHNNNSDIAVETNEVSIDKRQIWFVFSGMGSQWTAMAKSLINIEIFEKSLEASAKVLNKFNIDLLSILLDDKYSISSPVLSFVSIASIQIAFVDLLNELNITADGYIGHSIGELACAYADGCLTAEQTILFAYYRGKCVEETQLKPGLMAAIGLDWNEAQRRCPDGVYAACHNAEDSVTISGDRESVEEFLSQLSGEDIFNRKVDSNGIAYHSPSLNAIIKPLSTALKSIDGSSQKTVSSKWISTTYSDDKYDEYMWKYFVDNLINPVLFDDALKQIPPNSIVIEISAHSLLEPIIKRSLGSNVSYLPLMKRNNDRNINLFLTSIGKLYTFGFNPLIEKLYPKVDYPVSRGTPMISPLIKWNHEKSYIIYQYPDYFNGFALTTIDDFIDINDKQYMYTMDHCIDGRILFPATGYLLLVWKKLAKDYGVEYDKLPVVFEDVTLHRATILSKTIGTKFIIRILKTNGNFAVIENDTEIVTGRVYAPHDYRQAIQYSYVFDGHMENDLFNTENIILETKDVYKELRLRGYDYGPDFRCITKLAFNNEKMRASIKWTNNWVTFVDCMLQSSIFSKSVRGLYLPTRIDRLGCDPILFNATTRLSGDTEPEIPVVLDYYLNICTTKGIEFRGLKASIAPRKINAQMPVLECYKFVANQDPNSLDCDETQYLQKYQNACDSVAVNVAEKYGLDLKEIVRPNVSAFNSFDESIFESEEKCHLLRYLNELNTLENNCTEILFPETLVKIACDDMLNDSINKESFLRPIIDLVIENIGSIKKINILEANTTSALVSSVALDLINIYSNFVANCSLLHPSPDDLSQELLHSMQTYQWIQDKTSLPADLNNRIDFVIYKDISISHYLASKCTLNLPNLFETLKASVKSNGFVLVLCKDNVTFAEKVISTLVNTTCFVSRNQQIINEAEKCGFMVIANRFDSVSISGILLRKVIPEIKFDKQIFIAVNNNYEAWIKELQTSLNTIDSKSVDENIWLISDEQENNGLIGLINCLRLEPNGDRLRCIVNSCNNKKLDETHVKALVKRDLAVNVIKNGTIGTFRHKRINNMSKPVNTEHCFINIQTKGDLSSLKWFEAQHKYWPIGRKPNQYLCNVYYATLNFKDIMLATGKLPADALPDDQALQDCVLGIEFSGRDQNGDRVMGLVPSRALATSVVIENKGLLWRIPDNWSMEEASTVPAAYATTYYALIIRGKLQRNESVLIHSGSGAVGQAAINICLSMDCNIFITVGSDAKRQFLLNEYPKLNEKNFASSRDLNFENHIMNATNGRGVDIVLNSLAEEKLQASVRCLAINGRFLEIGKFDLSQNSILNSSNLIQNKTFHGIILDSLMSISYSSPFKEKEKKIIYNLLNEGINNGTVKPIKRNVFNIDAHEEAFRYMASGKHIGKVVIKIRDEEHSGIGYKTIRNLAIPRTVFYQNKTYIIVGGIGGFGLELANWMIERGAINIILTSRRGPTEPYHYYRLKHFKDNGCQVIISKNDASTMKGAEDLLNEAQKIAPIGGIFNLALVLNDCLFENMTAMAFEKVCAPKAEATLYLDELSRKQCTKLDYFVCFSSVACGRGNVGQSNYGYANSVMERVCDSRRDNGYHGLAIQWGAIGDVGYVMDNFQLNDIVISGTMPQRVPSCLATLDQLLQSPYSVCSSMLLADTKAQSMGKKESLLITVAHILGVKDYENLAPNTTLVELGMDSLMAVELKQSLERDYDLVMSLQEIRKLNISKLAEISDGIKTTAKPEVVPVSSDIKFSIPVDGITHLNDIRTGEPVFVIPALEGNFDLLREVVLRLNRPAIGINWTYECRTLKTIEDVAKHFLTVIARNSAINNNFDIIGYSYGGVVGFEIGIELERQSKKLRKLILLDSSPKMLKMGTEEGVKFHNLIDEENAEIEGMLAFMMQYLPIDYNKLKPMLQNMPKEEREAKVSQLFAESSGVTLDAKTISFAAQSFYNKCYMTHMYSTENLRFNGDTLLIRATEHIVNNLDITDLPHDYGLSDICSGKLDVISLEGGHKTFLSNYKQIIDYINPYLAK